MSSDTTTALYADIRGILDQARKVAYDGISAVMMEAYWNIGKRIVEEEQQGDSRATYGRQLLQNLSGALTSEFGRGYSCSSLKDFRRFYNEFPDFLVSAPSEELPKTKPNTKRHTRVSFSQTDPDSICSTRGANLQWSHYKLLMRVSDVKARNWYLRETSSQMWSVRTLSRNIASQYYERILLSQANTEPVIAEMREKTRALQKDKLEFIKSPAVLEFLGLPPNTGYTEKILEKAILENLQRFMLELGKGFAFVASQKHIRTEHENYFVDLVFYNYILKCFVLMDLKTEKIAHQDVGQMDMYVRIYDELIKAPDDNPTIGIVLCSETDQDIARYSVMKGNEQLFASKYKLFLPSEEELSDEIQREKQNVIMQLREAGIDYSALGTLEVLP